MWDKDAKKGVVETNLCPFRLWASRMMDESSFQIKSLKSTHICLIDYNLGSLIWDYGAEIEKSNPGSTVQINVQTIPSGETIFQRMYYDVILLGVHCFAYQLQLTLVVVAKKHSKISYFILLLDNVVNFVGGLGKHRDMLREQFAKIFEALSQVKSQVIEASIKKLI
ncbi:hypothetical protein OSB04_012219 [Centaurea solstitialis]|uniref:Uncharacterized protein n=1 Tax=Centaurea solstitialis TaxID=347529 RepID=A0AA38TMQ3_9ASTR|nr:hypothetical protein OSB04_012219 [Centaurea solstitialis]